MPLPGCFLEGGEDAGAKLLRELSCGGASRRRGRELSCGGVPPAAADMVVRKPTLSSFCARDVSLAKRAPVNFVISERSRAFWVLCRVNVKSPTCGWV